MIGQQKSKQENRRYEYENLAKTSYQFHTAKYSIKITKIKEGRDGNDAFPAHVVCFTRSC